MAVAEAVSDCNVGWSETQSRILLECGLSPGLQDKKIWDNYDKRRVTDRQR